MLIGPETTPAYSERRQSSPKREVMTATTSITGRPDDFGVSRGAATAGFRGGGGVYPKGAQKQMVLIIIFIQARYTVQLLADTH